MQSVGEIFIGSSDRGEIFITHRAMLSAGVGRISFCPSIALQVAIGLIQEAEEVQRCGSSVAEALLGPSKGFGSPITHWTLVTTAPFVAERRRINRAIRSSTLACVPHFCVTRSMEIPRARGWKQAKLNERSANRKAKRR